MVELANYKNKTFVLLDFWGKLVYALFERDS